MEKINLDDERWGGYLPWFFRAGEFAATGNYFLFFERLSQRLDRLFAYNEPGIQNLEHFGDLLETESFQYFRHIRNKSLFSQISLYFHPNTLKQEFEVRIYNDPEVKKAYEITAPPVQFDKLHDTLREIAAHNNSAKLKGALARKTRAGTVYLTLFNERLGVMEVLLRILPKSGWTDSLIVDIRRFFAEAKIMLDIKGYPPLVVPMEEPLLQRGVIDNLIPRLEARFPERADELVQCYHKLLKGQDIDSIFLEAFKTLEEIARSITNDKKFQFDKSNLNKYFPGLHSTIHETMIKLAGHRGDKAGHGKDSPPPHEIRYLLFMICNIALLLLDYK